MAKSVLAQAGFADTELDTALGVSYGESGGYSDAVGDLALMTDKWGPSIGLFQIRSLRHPELYAGTPDALRDAEKLLDPVYNARVALELQRWLGWRLWTVWRNNPDITHDDYEILTGHERAHLWNS